MLIDLVPKCGPSPRKPRVVRSKFAQILHQERAELMCPKRLPEQHFARCICRDGKRRVEYGVFQIGVALQRGKDVRSDPPLQVMIMRIRIVLVVSL
jgi:hypothetical protein